MSKFFCRRAGKKLIWLLLLLLLGGCGVRQVIEGRLQPPEIKLQAVTIRPPASGCWPLSVTLALTNPNAESLQLLGYDYEISLAGQDLIRGESSSRLVLPAGGEASLEIPVLLNLEAVPPVLGPLLMGAKVPYALAGGVRLAQVLGGLRVPFRFRGELTQEEGLHYLKDFLAPTLGRRLPPGSVSKGEPPPGR